MDELEVQQPEENVEPAPAEEAAEPSVAEEAVEAVEVEEAPEQVEEQALEEAAHEPGAHVEETQTFEQAEVIEETLAQSVEMVDVETQESLTKEEGRGDDGDQATPIVIPDVATEAAVVDLAIEDDGEGGRQNLAEVPDPDTTPPPPNLEADSSVRSTPSLEQEPEPGPTPEEGPEPGFHAPAENPDPGDPPPPPHMEESVSGQVALDHPGTGGRVAQESEPGGTPPTPDAVVGLSPDDVKDEFGSQVALDHPGTGGRVAQEPEPLPDPGDDLTPDRMLNEEPQPGPDPFPRPAQNPEPGPEPSLSPGVDGNVAQSPEPGPHPFPQPAEDPNPGTEPPEPNLVGEEPDSGPDPFQRIAEGPDPGFHAPAESPEPGGDPPGPNMMGETAELGLEALEGGMLVTEDGEFIVMGMETETIEGSQEAEGESEQDVPEEGEGGEGGEESPNWYIHEDSEGNVTVVDEDGNPVDSPPKIVYFQGKYYAIYPGDDFPVKEDGSVTDSNKLAEYEISSYKPSTEGMKIYSDKEGNPVVVDEDGNPVASPPGVVQDPTTGKYYFVTETDPSKMASFAKSGNFAAALAQGLIKEATGYKPPTEGMQIYYDQDGNAVVVDGDGNPVQSPPAVIQDPTTGKYYFVTETDPSKMASFTKSGNFAEALSQGLIKEAPGYEPPTEGMQIYYDKDGNAVVVDGDGNPVESPPAVIQDPTTGKYYFVTETDPSKMASFTKSGNFAEALTQGLIKEAPDYKPPTEGMKIYSDNDGNPVVVDENGKPVESPPAVMQDPTTGKYYFVTETDPSKMASFTKSGNFAEALSQGLIKEAPNYKPPTEGIHIYPDDEGNPIVVDENGKPVESPPGVIQDPSTGKYYFVTETDPSKLSSFAKSGNFADALSQGLIKEAPDYKPPWWKKKVY